MRIENTTKKQFFGLKIPEHIKKTGSKIDGVQKNYAQKRFFEIEHCLGNEYEIQNQYIPNPKRKGTNDSHNLILQIIGKELKAPIILSERSVANNLLEKEKNKIWYNMLMSLTPDGIKKVVKTMGNDYLP